MIESLSARNSKAGTADRVVARVRAVETDFDTDSGEKREIVVVGGLESERLGVETFKAVEVRGLESEVTDAEWSRLVSLLVSGRRVGMMGGRLSHDFERKAFRVHGP